MTSVAEAQPAHPRRALGRRAMVAIGVVLVVAVGAGAALALNPPWRRNTPSDVVRAMVAAVRDGDCDGYWATTAEGFRELQELITCDDFDAWVASLGRHEEMRVDVVSAEQLDSRVTVESWNAVVLATLAMVDAGGQPVRLDMRYTVMRDLAIGDHTWRVWDEEVLERGFGTDTSTTEPPADEPPPAPEPPPAEDPPSIDPAEARGESPIEVDASGGIAPFDHGAPADEVIAYLTEQLGEPQVVSPDTGCGPAAIPGRTLRWGGLEVAFFTVDEQDLTTPTSEYLAGWTLMEPAGDVQALMGLQPGQTVADLEMTYPRVSGHEWMSPDVWLWSDLTGTDLITAVTSGGDGSDTILTLAGGYWCGE